MNNKLRELAKEVGISFGGHPMNPLSVYPSQLQKFAELVIKECASVVEMDTDYKNCFKWCDEKILEHFGVE